MNFQMNRTVVWRGVLAAAAMIVCGAQTSPPEVSLHQPGSSSAATGKTHSTGTAPKAAAAPAAQSQNNSPITEQHQSGAWTIRCFRAAGSPCAIAQDVIAKPRNVRELGVSIFYILGRNVYAGDFVVPLGVSFAKGMTITVGSYSLPNLKFLRCQQEGCYVAGVLPQALIDAMAQSGETMGSVQIQAVNGHSYAFPFKLDGFAEGIALLKQIDAERPSAAPAKP
jgi:invasion protein IalB